MNLKKLTLRNIRSYQEEEIQFPLGASLLSGDVGSGKTTILLAIEHALFGLQPGQRGASLLANGKDEGAITLEFDIDEKNVIIERVLKRAAKGVNQEYAAITLDNVKEELSVTELKTRILELLNYPQEFLKKTNILYRYTVYTPQEEMKEIITEDPESRLDVLRHIFGIDKYRKIKENVLLVAGRLREELRSLQFEVRDMEDTQTRLSESRKKGILLAEEIEQKKAALKDKKKSRKDIEDNLLELEQKVGEKQRFEREIEKANILLSNKLLNAGEYELQIKTLEEQIAQETVLFNEEDYQAVITAIARERANIDVFQGKLIDTTGKLRSLTGKVDENKDKMTRIAKLEVCPTCLQEVSVRHKHVILNDTESIINLSEKEIAAIILEVQDLKKRIDATKSNIIELEKAKARQEMLRFKTLEVQTAKKKIGDLIKSKETIQKDIEVLASHLTTLKQSVLEFSKFNTLLKIKNEELKNAFQEEKQVEIVSAGIEKELELTKKDITRIEEELAKKEKSRSRLVKVSNIEKWLTDDFTSLISFTERNIMIKLREEFSKLFNKWFGMLTTDSFYVQLDENFTPIIMQGDFELDYAYLSGGERTAVALAYRLALNQIINSLLSNIKTRNLIILDEPTDGFSEQQLDKVRDIFQELAVDQLIIVSHEQKIESFVDNVMKIRKVGGHSTRK